MKPDRTEQKLPSLDVLYALEFVDTKVTVNRTASKVPIVLSCVRPNSSSIINRDQTKVFSA